MNHSIVSRKREFRKEVKRRISELDRSERRRLSSLICHALADLPQLQSARSIFLYAALPDEVDLQELADLVRRRGCSLAYPVIQRSNGLMYFKKLPETIAPADMKGISADRLLDPASGQHGDYPAEKQVPGELIPEAGTVILSPGRAFGHDGSRIGRAGGYYDRYFSRHGAGLPDRKWLTIGVGFSCQLFPSLPAAEYDIFLDMILTESGLISPPSEATLQIEEKPSVED
ncbi:5-formyltetrahydrofolate cyclo-ligase [Spirochaeta dissipatitropha]